MSTRKDGTKTSNLSKKKIRGISQTPTRAREESTERSNTKKTEVSVKAKTNSSSLTNLKDKSADNIRVKSQISKSVLKTEKPVKVPTSLNEKKIASDATKVSKRNVPVTPPSKRVSKTQYFPSKSLYSNALKIDEETPNNSVASTSRETKTKEIRTKTSSTKISVEKERSRISTKNTNVKDKNSSKKISEERNTYRTKARRNIEYKDVSPDSSSISERPRTATLKKGSIVNDNIVGPDVPKPLVPKPIKEVVKVKSPSPEFDNPNEYNYEDDFESYESDFEAYSSSSSNNLDNISGEETSSVSSSQSIDNLALPRELKSAQKRVASAGTDDERKLDSGNFDMPDYKHKQMLDNIKESVEKENANLKMQEVQRNNPASLSDEGFEEQKSLQFINFLDAKKKNAHRKSMEIKRKRGEDILNMIRLDTVSYTLFDLPPVPYEVFIQNYGRSNTIQTAVQTNEDNINEEIQTEEIIRESRWTQFPVCFSKIESTDPNYWQIYKSDYLGAGCDNMVEEKNTKKINNENSLNKFLLSAGALILKIQTESLLENYEKVQKNSREMPFSDGYILFNTTKDIFKDSSVKCLSFCCDNNNKIMTVHVRKQRETEGYGSLVCIWNICNSDEPESFFISFGHISCCSFGLTSSDFIYAGLNDGTISVWNTKRKIYNEDSLLKRSPLYTTEIGFGHNNKVVSLHPFINHIEKTACFQSKQTNEICSLDEEGDIILWSVIMKHDSTKTTLTSSTNWSDVVLVKNTRISLRILHPELEDLQCTDFIVNTVNSNYVFVSTNYGFIIHHLIKGGRSNVKKFAPESESIANCLETCPFSSNYFLAGFNDGNINLYSRLVEKPLMVLSDKEGKLENCGIQMIQWSRNKPFVMYTKDSSNTIHIWDLNESDIYPTYSIPFKDDITCMKLSNSAMENNTRKSYMMIGTGNGQLYLHLLNDEHAQQQPHVYEDHVTTFLKYVNRL